MHVSVLFQRPIILGPYIFSAAIRCKVGAQSSNQVLVVLATFVDLDIEVPTVNDAAAQRALHTSACRATVCVPKILADSFGLRL